MKPPHASTTTTCERRRRAQHRLQTDVSKGGVHITHTRARQPPRGGQHDPCVASLTNSSQALHATPVKGCTSSLRLCGTVTGVARYWRRRGRSTSRSPIAVGFGVGVGDVIRIMPSLCALFDGKCWVQHTSGRLDGVRG